MSRYEILKNKWYNIMALEFAPVYDEFTYLGEKCSGSDWDWVAHLNEQFMDVHRGMASMRAMVEYEYEQNNPSSRQDDNDYMKEKKE